MNFDVAQHKTKLQSYFNGVGFERWSAIYGQGPLTGVRRSVRDGHTMMMDRAEAWLLEQGLPTNAHIFDAGCGTGLFSIRLARRGFRVTAADIAPQMVRTASQQAHQAGAAIADRIRFVAGDLEVVGGTYDAVVCFDVLIHYPRPAFAQLCSRLARLSRGPLILTYAPYNRLLAFKHWLGGHFPHSQRRTDIQMMPGDFVRHTLEQAGMRVRRQVPVSCGFYHVVLLEAEKQEFLNRFGRVRF
ncbi:MAG: magnesium protoporphyrin IX methyltransferase [Chloroflexaceae bacterium]|nr:magnesium protoporphyrin IX methyltransferase [Chloroflexaceae bacterium]